MARKGSQPSSRTFMLVVCEAALILLAVVLAAWIRLGSSVVDVFFVEHGLLKALVIAVGCQACLYYADLYDLRIVADRRELFVRTLQALGAASLAMAAVYYLVPDLIIGRGVFVLAAVCIVLVTIGWRLGFEWAGNRVRPRERLLLVGTSPAAVRLAKELHERRLELGVEIVGFIDTDSDRVGEALVNPGIIGAVDDIPSLVKTLAVDRVVVSLNDARGKLPMDKLLDMRMAGLSFVHLPSVYEEYTGKIAVENLRPSWLIFSDGFTKVKALGGVTGLIDLVAGGLLLVLALPVMALAAIAIKLTSRGPALYRQRRVGLNGRGFTIYKLRSMYADAEAATGPVWATPGRDPRVTTVGAFLRRSRIDELPQLWTVFIGDMSLVGPRPERPEFVKSLTEQIPFYGQRHAVRPGVTGWAQVRYSYGASVEDATEKLQYDLFYVKNKSVALDLYIIFETLKTVLTRSGS